VAGVFENRLDQDGRGSVGAAEPRRGEGNGADDSVAIGTPTLRNVFSQLHLFGCPETPAGS